jgi:FkbH-like protein
MYSEESLRKKILKQSKNFNDYLKSLNMKITFNKVNKKNLDRIEQLCNRTNQFNFSAKRYDKKKLNELKKSQNHHLYIANLKDNFGDYGLISFAIVEIINNDSYIDTFLMSCRALGKKVENAFLSFIYDDIKSKGINNLFSIYFKNKKNKVAYDFIINNRFSLISKNKNKYIHKINKMNKKNNYFKIKNNIKN